MYVPAVCLVEDIHLFPGIGSTVPLATTMRTIQNVAIFLCKVNRVFDRKPTKTKEHIVQQPGQGYGPMLPIVGHYDEHDGSIFDASISGFELLRK